MPRPRRPLRCEALEDRATPVFAGDLDLTFGTDGVALLPTADRAGDPFTATAVAVQSDGKVIVAGWVRPQSDSAISANDDFQVIRLTADGQLDPTFGTDGVTRVAFDLTGPSAAPYANSDTPAAVAVQPDGKVVVVGTAALGVGVSPYDPTSPAVLTSLFAVTRLTADGRLDPSFDGDGKATVRFTDDTSHSAKAYAVAVQPDGRIVLAGGDSRRVAAVPGQPPPVVSTPPSDVATARLLPDGRLDPTFGTGGTVTVSYPLGGYENVTAGAVDIDPAGRVVLAGQVAVSKQQVSSSRFANTYDAAVIRLTPDGQLDSAFGDGGRAHVNFDPAGLGKYTTRLRALADGRLVLTQANYAVRLTADGRLDPTYSGDGVATATLAPETTLRGIPVAILRDGRVVFAGPAATDSAPPSYPTRAVRLTADGQRDPAFAPDALPGVILGYFGELILYGLAAVGPDESVVLAGSPAVEPGASPLRGLLRLRGVAPTPAVTGAVLAGGTADGTAGILVPVAGTYFAAGPLAFFPGISGAVRTATADVNGDGTPDYVGGAAPGDAPAVAVLDGKSGLVLATFLAFERTFTGGVFVAAGDVDGDGKADVIVTPDRGGGPVVAVFGGAALAAGRNEAAEVARFFGIDDPDFRGGARPAAGDLTGDGAADLVVSAGFLGGPRVAVYDGRSVATGAARPARLVNDFFAFEPTLRNGAFVAVGDVTGDGKADVAFGGGPGGGPRVRVFDGTSLIGAGAGGSSLDQFGGQVANFFAGDSALRGGVRVALRDADGDGKADLLTGSGDNEAARVRVYRAATLTAGTPAGPDQEMDPFGGGAALADGVFVG